MIILTVFAAVSAYAGTVPDGPALRNEAAVVNVSAAYLRAAPDYESALETQELMGMPVRVIERDRYWVRVATSQPYDAWVNEMALAFMTEEEVAGYEAAPKYMVSAMHSAVLESPAAGARQLCDLVAGDLLRADSGGKRVRGHVPVILPDGRRGWVDGGHVCRHEQLRKAQAGLTDEQAGHLAARTALKYLGIPYLWGGMSSNGVDCSGLVRLSYMLGAGIMLPRNASQQYAAGEDIPLSAAGAGEDVELSALREGDLLFFGPTREDGTRAITHVGIYLGDGRMIHASQVVRINSLRRGDADLYENAGRLHKACRIHAPCGRIVK